MYFKIPLDADLTNTSYRCRKDTKTAIYIEYNEGVTFEDWAEISEAKARQIAPEWFEVAPVVDEPTEQEIINAEILLSMAEIQARHNEQDETLAAILLNQMGV